MRASSKTLHEQLSVIRISGLLYKFLRPSAWSGLSGVWHNGLHVIYFLACFLYILFHEHAIKFHGNYLQEAPALRVQSMLSRRGEIQGIVINLKIHSWNIGPCILCFLCISPLLRAIVASVFCMSSNIVCNLLPSTISFALSSSIPLACRKSIKGIGLTLNRTCFNPLETFKGHYHVFLSCWHFPGLFSGEWFLAVCIKSITEGHLLDLRYPTNGNPLPARTTSF